MLHGEAIRATGIIREDLEIPLLNQLEKEIKSSGES